MNLKKFGMGLMAATMLTVGAGSAFATQNEGTMEMQKLTPAMVSVEATAIQPGDNIKLLKAPDGATMMEVEYTEAATCVPSTPAQALK